LSIDHDGAGAKRNGAAGILGQPKAEANWHRLS
jgi:hypothetical protein